MKKIRSQMVKTHSGHAQPKHATAVALFKDRAKSIFMKYTYLFILGLTLYAGLLALALLDIIQLPFVVLNGLPFGFIFLLIAFLCSFATYELMSDFVGKQSARSCSIVVSMAFLMFAIFIKIIF